VPAMTDISVVILTMGNRPTELEAAVAAVRAQQVEATVVLVVNGGEPNRALADVVVDPGTNLGIPAGRNAGAAATPSDLIAFLDDDGALVDEVLQPAMAAFAENPGLGALALRIVDEEGVTARRHLSGLRKRPEQSGPATSFPGGAVLVRRSAFAAVGGLCDSYFYGLEETDLAWRLIDAGWDINYRADLRFSHPRSLPSRHDEFFHHTARNRVWLAHRTLPAPLAALYVVNWTLITVARNVRNPRGIVQHVRGTIDGFQNLVGPRTPMSSATVRELTRRGRPPVV
jgi:GT2 family glycosyltransferase